MADSFWDIASYHAYGRLRTAFLPQALKRLPGQTGPIPRLAPATHMYEGEFGLILLSQVPSPAQHAGARRP